MAGNFFALSLPAGQANRQLDDLPGSANKKPLRNSSAHADHETLRPQTRPRPLHVPDLIEALTTSEIGE